MVRTFGESVKRAGSEVIEWLWQYCVQQLVKEDLFLVQKLLLQSLWSSLAVRQELGIINDLAAMIMDENLLLCIQSGQCPLLDRIFSNCYRSSVSYEVGAAYTNWLYRLGVSSDVFAMNSNL